MPLTIYTGGAMFQHSRDGVNDEQYQVMSTKWTYIFKAHFHKPIKWREKLGNEIRWTIYGWFSGPNFLER